MGEVRARTGFGERTVYRRVDEGKLRQAQREMPRRRPATVFHPDDVAALAEPMAKPLILPAANGMTVGMAETLPVIPPQRFWEALIARMETRKEPLAETPAPLLPSLAELRQKVLVTIEEAKRLGFSGSILAAAVREGRLERLSGGRFRMRDLELL